MKLKALVTLLCVFALAGCEQNIEIGKTSEMQQQEILLKTKIDDNLCNKVESSVINYLCNKISTRSVNSISETEVGEILAPLAGNGACVRDELVSLSEAGMLDISEAEAQELNEMEPDELAAFAYFLNVLETSEEENVAIEQKGEMLECKLSDVVECIGFATGVSALNGIWSYVDGTATICTAKTAFTLARGFIGRTLGFVGVAIAIYDFVDCMHKK